MALAAVPIAGWACAWMSQEQAEATFVDQSHQLAETLVPTLLCCRSDLGHAGRGPVDIERFLDHLAALVGVG